MYVRSWVSVCVCVSCVMLRVSNVWRNIWVRYVAISLVAGLFWVSIRLFCIFFVPSSRICTICSTKLIWLIRWLLLFIVDIMKIICWVGSMHCSSRSSVICASWRNCRKRATSSVCIWRSCSPSSAVWSDVSSPFWFRKWLACISAYVWMSSNGLPMCWCCWCSTSWNISRCWKATCCVLRCWFRKFSRRANVVCNWCVIGKSWNSSWSWLAICFACCVVWYWCSVRVRWSVCWR